MPRWVACRDGTSLSQISEASHATIGSIYHFFPGGKEALAVAVVESTGAAYRELFEAIAGAASNPAQAYADFFAGAAAVLEETDFIDPCPIGGVAREVANTNEPMRLATAGVFDSWIDASARHLGEAGLPEARAAQLAQVFVATVEGAFVLSRAQRSTTALEAAGRTFSELVTRELAEARIRGTELPTPDRPAQATRRKR
ncbi:MAG: TetR family transcriptional regulator C-terminal domain-containing protein [Acidimicrobiales bacterium]